MLVNIDYSILNYFMGSQFILLGYPSLNNVSLMISTQHTKNKNGFYKSFEAITLRLKQELFALYFTCILQVSKQLYHFYNNLTVTKSFKLV